MAVLTIYLVSTITFFLMNLVPGGPFLAEKAVSPQAIHSTTLHRDSRKNKIVG